MGSLGTLSEAAASRPRTPSPLSLSSALLLFRAIFSTWRSAVDLFVSSAAAPLNVSSMRPGTLSHCCFLLTQSSKSSINIRLLNDETRPVGLELLSSHFTDEESRAQGGKVTQLTNGGGGIPILTVQLKDLTRGLQVSVSFSFCYNNNV